MQPGSEVDKKRHYKKPSNATNPEPIDIETKFYGRMRPFMDPTKRGDIKPPPEHASIVCRKWSKGRVLPYYSDAFPRAQEGLDLLRWAQMVKDTWGTMKLTVDEEDVEPKPIQTYPISYTDSLEPHIVIFDRQCAPIFDDQWRGCGGDMGSWTWLLASLGFEFMVGVGPSCFGILPAEPTSQGKLELSLVSAGAEQINGELGEKEREDVKIQALILRSALMQRLSRKVHAKQCFTNFDGKCMKGKCLVEFSYQQSSSGSPTNDARQVQWHAHLFDESKRCEWRLGQSNDRYWSFGQVQKSKASEAEDEEEEKQNQTQISSAHESNDQEQGDSSRDTRSNGNGEGSTLSTSVANNTSNNNTNNNKKETALSRAPMWALKDDSDDHDGRSDAWKSMVFPINEEGSGVRIHLFFPVASPSLNRSQLPSSSPSLGIGTGNGNGGSGGGLGLGLGLGGATAGLASVVDQHKSPRDHRLNNEIDGIRPTEGSSMLRTLMNTAQSAPVVGATSGGVRRIASVPPLGRGCLGGNKTTIALGTERAEDGWTMLEYQVYFPHGFPWQFGGTLPGMQISADCGEEEKEGHLWMIEVRWTATGHAEAAVVTQGDDAQQTESSVFHVVSQSFPLLSTDRWHRVRIVLENVIEDDEEETRSIAASRGAEDDCGGVGSELYEGSSLGGKRWWGGGNESDGIRPPSLHNVTRSSTTMEAEMDGTAKTGALVNGTDNKSERGFRSTLASMVFGSKRSSSSIEGGNSYGAKKTGWSKEQGGSVHHERMKGTRTGTRLRWHVWLDGDRLLVGEGSGQARRASGVVFAAHFGRGGNGGDGRGANGASAIMSVRNLQLVYRA